MVVAASSVASETLPGRIDQVAAIEHGRYGRRFSEGLDTVKDMTEKALDTDAKSLISKTESAVTNDMSKDFSSYGHHMWDLK